MQESQTGFKEIGGQKIYYRVVGSGPPLIFVHGWTLNLNYWDAQVAHFSDHFCTYSYDWRGMGKSSGDTPEFTMEQLGEDLAGFIASFDLDRPIICGHSEGGAIAAQYAAMHPDGLSALILADTDLNSVAASIAGKLEFELTDFFAHLEERHGKNPLEAMMPNLEKNLYSAGFIATRPDYIAAWRQQFLSNSVAGVINGLRAWDWRSDLSKQLKGLPVPTLLLWGMQDAMIRLDQMQAMQAQLGAVSQLSTLPESGHMSPVEVPETFNRVMEGFLQQQSSGASQ